MKQSVKPLACKLTSQVPVSAQAASFFEDDETNTIDIGNNLVFRTSADPGDLRVGYLLLYRPDYGYDMTHIAERRQSQNANARHSDFGDRTPS
jgi:hypothetical protein